jgi:hypothetical protein
MKSLQHRFENFKSMPFAYRIICPVCRARRLQRCAPSIGRNIATPHPTRKKLAIKHYEHMRHLQTLERLKK